MIYKVEIRGKHYGKNRTAPGWNDRLSASARHPLQGAKMEKDFVMICANAIRLQLRRVHIEKPVKITYVFHESDRKRDVGNCAYIDKPFSDALQITNVLKNDNQNYVKEVHFILGDLNKQNPFIEVFIEELETDALKGV